MSTHRTLPSPAGGSKIPALGDEEPKLRKLEQQDREPRCGLPSTHTALTRVPPAWETPACVGEQNPSRCSLRKLLPNKTSPYHPKGFIFYWSLTWICPNWASLWSPLITHFGVELIQVMFTEHLLCAKGSISEAFSSKSYNT